MRVTRNTCLGIREESYFCNDIRFPRFQSCLVERNTSAHRVPIAVHISCSRSGSLMCIDPYSLLIICQITAHLLPDSCAGFSMDTRTGAYLCKKLFADTLSHTKTISAMTSHSLVFSLVWWKEIRPHTKYQ